LLAGLIGAAANAGFALVGFISLGINQLHGILASWGLADDWVKWRLLMLVGLVPALLTFIIRLFVPESEDWEAEKAKGATDGWRSEDLFGVLLGAVASLAILALWANNLSYPVRLVGTVALMAVVLVGYLYPVRKYLGRMGTGPEGAIILGRMQLGASLSGIALLGTWASMQWAPTWVGKISTDPDARAWTQIASATGAIFGGMFGAYLGAMAGRRVAYAVLCLLSLASVQYFYRMNDGYNTHFLASAFVAGGLTASFYGWLPLYLPELFPTRVRATAQGFCFNFGRIIAAIGALQTGALMKGVFEEDYAKACSFMSLVYLAGPVLILFAPMTVARSGIFGGTSKAFPEETNQNGLET
jgi:MFS family permease